MQKVKKFEPVGSITLVTDVTVSAPPRVCCGDNVQSQILKSGDQEKMSAWGDLKSSFHRYLPEGLLCFLPKKTL